MFWYRIFITAVVRRYTQESIYSACLSGTVFLIIQLHFCKCYVLSNNSFTSLCILLVLKWKKYKYHARSCHVNYSDAQSQSIVGGYISCVCAATLLVWELQGIATALRKHHLARGAKNLTCTLWQRSTLPHLYNQNMLRMHLAGLLLWKHWLRCYKWFYWPTYREFYHYGLEENVSLVLVPANIFLHAWSSSSRGK